MKPLHIACALALGLTVAVSAPIAFAEPAQSTASIPASTPAASELHATMRSLYHNHIVATRDYALAVHAGNQAAAAQAADAVVANAHQIADIVSTYYGQHAGTAMFELLDDQWTSVKALIDHARTDNLARVASEKRRMTAWWIPIKSLPDSATADSASDQQKAMDGLARNATATARFLASINPNWSQDILQGVLMARANDGRTGIDEIMSNAPAAARAESWSRVEQRTNAIADTLSAGIAKQFPGKAS